jgi:hypothetical protein
LKTTSFNAIPTKVTTTTPSVDRYSSEPLNGLAVAPRRYGLELFPLRRESRAPCTESSSRSRGRRILRHGSLQVARPSDTAVRSSKGDVFRSIRLGIPKSGRFSTCWLAGQHGWANPIQWIFTSVWLPRSPLRIAFCLDMDYIHIWTRSG